MNVASVRLANYCEVITKGTTPTTLGFDFSESGIPFLRVQNLADGGLDFRRDALFINEETHAALSRSQIKPGDVLVSIAGTIGRAAVVPDNAPPMNCNQAISIVRTKGDIFRPFLRYWIESADAQAQIRSATVTGTISNLSLGQIGSLRIPLPSLEDQRRIAEVLDRADVLRAKRRAAVAQLDNLTQSIFLYMFGDPVTNQRKLSIVRLGDVCDVRDGTHDSPKYISEGGYPLVTSKNLSTGVLNLTNVNRISEVDYAQINKRSKVDIGDIVMPMIGTIGSPVLVDCEPNFAIKNVALIKFGELSPSATFVHHVLVWCLTNKLN